MRLIGCKLYPFRYLSVVAWGAMLILGNSQIVEAQAPASSQAEKTTLSLDLEKCIDLALRNNRQRRVSNTKATGIQVSHSDHAAFCSVFSFKSM